MTSSKLPELNRALVETRSEDCFVDDVDACLDIRTAERSFTGFSVDSISQGVLDVIDLLEQESYDDARKRLRSLGRNSDLSVEENITVELLYLYADAGLVAQTPDLRCKTRIQDFYDIRLEELAGTLPEEVHERLKQDGRRLLRAL